MTQGGIFNRLLSSIRSWTPGDWFGFIGLVFVLVPTAVGVLYTTFKVDILIKEQEELQSSLKEAEKSLKKIEIDISVINERTANFSDIVEKVSELRGAVGNGQLNAKKTQHN